jgi:hypothetical protein
VTPGWLFRELTFLLSILLIYLACFRRNEPNSLAPQQTVQGFQMNADFGVELYAAQPHVVDPGALYSASVLDSSGADAHQRIPTTDFLQP